MKFLNKFKKMFLNYNANALQYSKKLIIKNIEISFAKLGSKNKNKVFYVIKRTPGAGLFSNVIFVLNHLLIAKRHHFIPIIDMQNFPTIYNENNRIDNTKNSWEYYFEKITKYNLDEVYNSKNVIITGNRFYRSMTHEINSNHFKDVKKYIKVKKQHINFANDYFNKNLKNKKILGVHYRGTSYKSSASHPFPPTKEQIIKKVDKLIKEKNFNAIFLCTEEKRYLELFKKKYKKKLFYIESFRSNLDNAFKLYPRKNHRYKLGKEILIETLILSKCNTFLHIDTNVSLFVKFFSKSSFPKFVILDNGYNSSNEYIAKWLWYIKNLLPSWLGGFKKII
tara:strand:- start:19653 stop:20663 length:1011 start_codon:yes stop_codon:yes gene_type:complete